MKRAWKWTRRVLVGVAAATAIALAAWVTVVPGIVRRIATRQLRGMGLRDVTLQLRGFSLSHVQMANVAAGEGERLRVGAVGVGFSLGGLFRGRLSTIELTGLEAEIRLRDGKLDLGPLAEISSAPGENPFRQILLRSSAVLLDLEGKCLRIPVEGTIDDLGGGKLTLGVRADAEGCRIELGGSVDTNTYDLDLSFAVHVREIAAMLAALPPRWGKLPINVSGAATVEGRCYRQKGRLALNGCLSAADMRLSGEAGGRRFSAGLGLTASARLADGQIESLSCHLDANDVAVSGLPAIEALDATALLRGGALTVPQATASGSGWSLVLAKCEASGVLDAFSGKASPIVLSVPAWRCTLDPQRVIPGLSGPGGVVQCAPEQTLTVKGAGKAQLSPTTKGSETAWAWHAGASEVEVAWGPADLRLSAAGVDLQGVRARIRLVVEANGEGIKAQMLADGSELAIDSLKLPWYEVRKIAQDPLVKVALGEKRLEAKVPFAGEKPDWSLDIPELVVKQAEADLVLPKGSGKVEGCQGSFTFWVKADPNDAKLGGAGAVSFRAGQFVAGGEPLRLGPAESAINVHCVSVGLDPTQPGFVEASFDAKTRGPVPVSLGQGVGLTVLGAEADFDGGWSAGGGISLGASVVMGVKTAIEHRLGDAVLKAHVPEADLDVGLVVPAAVAGETWPSTLRFSFRTALDGKPATASVAGAEVRVGMADVRGEVTLGGGAPAVEGRVTLYEVAATHKASGLAVAGLSAVVPVSWNSKEQAQGRFAIETVEAGGVKLANVSGTLGVADMKADFTVAVEPLKGAKMSVEGSLDASRGAPQGSARLSLPLFKLEDENELGRLVPQLKGLAASGTFGVEGFARLAGGQLRPTLTLTVLDGAFKSKAWDMEAGGAFATVRLSSLSPPLTPRKELQLALVKHAKVGKLAVKDGFLAFRLEPVEEAGKPTRWAVAVQRAEAGWCGGRLYDENLRFDPEAPQHTITVHAEDLKLSELLALVAGERATGVGAVSGMLPVTIRKWPDMRFGDGHLAAAPGQSGWMRFKDLEPLQPSIDGSAKAAARGVSESVRADFEKQFKERLTQALSDFEYDELKLDFVSGSGGKELLTRAFAKGRGHKGQRQEVGGLTLNFTGLEEALRLVLAIPRGR